MVTGPRLPSKKGFLGKENLIVLMSGRIVALQANDRELDVVEIPF